MNLLIAGLVLFIATHLIPSFPDFRSRIREKIKPGPYKGLFSLFSIISLVLIVYGLKHAPFEALYQPPSWGRHAAMLLMLPAIYLFFSTSLGTAPSSAKVFTGNPMNWGVIVWAIAHLLANGDKAHVLLFSSILVFSAISIVTSNKRGAKPALEKRPPPLKELAFIVVVFIAYAAIIWVHRYFTGMPVL